MRIIIEERGVKKFKRVERADKRERREQRRAKTARRQLLFTSAYL